MTDEPKITLKVKVDNILQMISNKVTSWSNTPSDDNYPSEKLVKDSLDNKASIGDLSTVATTGSYNDLSNKPTIPTVPTNISSFNNDSGYITSSSVPNPSSTTPSADTTNGSVGDGTTWARSNHTHPRSSLYAEASHTHDSIYPAYEIDNLNVDDVHYAAGHLHYESFSNAIYYSDVDGIGRIDKELAVKGDLPTIIDNLTTNDATKVLSAKQGKVLNDMIGDDDISAIGDGSVTGALTSLSTSIANYTTHLDNANYTVKYNDYKVIIDVHLSSTTFPPSLSAFNDNIIPSDCRPSRPVVVFLHNVNAIVSVRDTSNGIWRKSITGKAESASCYCHIEYSRV